jgi:hypothetical protein
VVFSIKSTQARFHRAFPAGYQDRPPALKQAGQIFRMDRALPTGSN